MNIYDEIVQIIEEAREDAEAFYNRNNNTAGTRLRKAMQLLKVKAQELRVDVQNTKNAK